MNPIRRSLPLAQYGIAFSIDLPHDSLPPGAVQAAAIRRIDQREDGALRTAHDPHHATDGRLPHSERAIIAGSRALGLILEQRVKSKALDCVRVLAEGAK